MLDFSMWLTQHFNNQRTGWNPYEATLTVENVPKLRRLFTRYVNGTIYAQPLVALLTNLPGVPRVVFVVTETNWVYAFDAVDFSQDPVWQPRQLDQRYSVNDKGDPIWIEGPVPMCDIGGCSNIAPYIGITSTPVIDIDTSTMYVVAKTKRTIYEYDQNRNVTKSTTTFHQYLHALDIATGQDKPGSPIETLGGVSAQWQLNRPGLLLHNGVLYIAFGSHCDFHGGDYHGLVLAYRASTLEFLRGFNSTPPSDGSGGLGGIWQSGMGLAADVSDRIYFATGNGPFDLAHSLFGDSVLKLELRLEASQPPRWGFQVVSRFTPDNQKALEQADSDLGSGGPIVLPDQPGAHPRMLVMCGKDGRVYLLDRETDGEMSLVRPFLDLQPGKPWRKGGDQPGVFGGPAYYAVQRAGGMEHFVYYAGDNGPLTAFSLQGEVLDFATLPNGRQNRSDLAFPGGGTTPIVSSRGGVEGTGIVWVLVRGHPLRLQAYDARDLTKKLFDEEVGPWNNINDGGAFIEPTVVAGKVYVGSEGQLTIFGLPYIWAKPYMGRFVAYVGPGVCAGTTQDIDILILHSPVSIINVLAPAPPFSIVSSSFDWPQALYNPGVERLTIRFAPATAGSYSSEIVITSDALMSPTISEGGTLKIPLFGETSNPQPLIATSPSQLAFGRVAIGNLLTKTTSITNVGQLPLTVKIVSLDNVSDPADPGFRIGQTQLPAPLSCGGTQLLTVSFSPQKVQAYSAVIRIESDASPSPLMVPMSGRGVEPKTKEGKEDKDHKETFKEKDKEKERDAFSVPNPRANLLELVEPRGETKDVIEAERGNRRAFVRPEERPAVGERALTELDEGPGDETPGLT